MPKVGKSLSMTLFASQQIKPKSMSWKGEIVDAYPLYASVIYGNLTTTVKVEKSGNPIMVTPGLEQLQEKELKNFTENFRNDVLEIVKKEVSQNGEKYSLAGLGTRLKKYDCTVSETVEKLTIKQANEVVLKLLGIESTDDPKEASYTILFAILALSTQDILKKMKVRDWIFGRGRTDLKNFLQAGIDFGQGKVPLENEDIDAMIECYDALLQK